MTASKTTYIRQLTPSIALLGATFIGVVNASDHTLPNMVKIPGGEFMMGTAFGDKRAQPLHKVAIKPFMMATHQVTMAEFRQFVEDTNYQMPQNCNDTLTENWLSGPNDQGDKNWQSHRYVISEYQPVTCTGLQATYDYVDWLSEKTGITFRLPTEQEWEYATRAGTTSHYFWGDDTNQTQACQYGNFADESSEYWASNQVGASYVGFLEHTQCNDNEPYITLVGMYRPNPFGLYDMLGNASNLLANCYYPEYKKRTAEEMDVTKCERIAHRGYSWHSPPANHSDRGRIPKTKPFAGVSFRLVTDDLTVKPNNTTLAFASKLNQAQQARKATRPTFLPTPNSLQLKQLDPGNYELSWQKVDDKSVTHYDVYLSTKPHSHLMGGFFKKHYEKLVTVQASNNQVKVTLPNEGGSLRVVAKNNTVGSLPSHAAYQTNHKTLDIPGNLDIQYVSQLVNAKLGFSAANETRPELYYITKINHGYTQEEVSASFNVNVKEDGWYKFSYRGRTSNDGVFYKVWQNNEHVGDIVYDGDKEAPNRNQVYLKKGESNLQLSFLHSGMDYWSMGGIELTKIEDSSKI